MERALETITIVGGLALWEPRFSVRHSELGSALLVVAVTVPDVETAVPSTLARQQLVPRTIANAAEFVIFVRTTLVGVIKHETDESFRVRGCPLREPHPELQKSAVAA